MDEELPEQSETSSTETAEDSEPATPEEVEGDGSSPSEEESDDGSGPSLYNFDLQSVEGIDRILALLPILDEDIVKAVYQEVFPGYPMDSIAPRMARIELRGFFMDFLDSAQAE